MTRANVIRAGRIHCDCVTAVVAVRIELFIVITVSFFCCALLCCGCERHARKSISRCGRQARAGGCYPQQHPDLPSGFAPAGVARNFCRQ